MKKHEAKVENVVVAGKTFELWWFEKDRVLEAIGPLPAREGIAGKVEPPVRDKPYSEARDLMLKEIEKRFGSAAQSTKSK